MEAHLYFMYKQDYDKETFIKRYGKPKKSEWIVNLDGRGDLGKFKTKSAALKYARAYMGRN